jgi:hypothetical protein
MRGWRGDGGFAHPWELILVDDGSRDGTGQRLVDGRALWAACARDPLSPQLRPDRGDAGGLRCRPRALIATLDGDLQNDPADIPRMVDELIERDLDLLQGWRRDRQDALVMRKIPSRIANRLIGRVTGVELHDYGCSLKVYRAEVIKEVRLFGEMHRFIPVWVAGVTAPERMGETEVTHRARQFGEPPSTASRGPFGCCWICWPRSSSCASARVPGTSSVPSASGLRRHRRADDELAVGGQVRLGEDIGQRPLLFVAILCWSPRAVPDHRRAGGGDDAHAVRLRRAHPSLHLLAVRSRRWPAGSSPHDADRRAACWGALLTSPWFLIAVVWLAFFWQLGAVPLYDLDEGAFTEATREMLASGNFITPHKDGEPRYDKPVLIYWLQAASVAAGASTSSRCAAVGHRRDPVAAGAVGFVRQRLDAATATVAALTMAWAAGGHHRQGRGGRCGAEPVHRAGLLRHLSLAAAAAAGCCCGSICGWGSAF